MRILLQRQRPPITKPQLRLIALTAIAGALFLGIPFGPIAGAVGGILGIGSGAAACLLFQLAGR